VEALKGSCNCYCGIGWENYPEGGGGPHQFWDHEGVGPD